VNYAGLDAGPVVVDATNDVPIIAALRDAYFVNGKVESFVQLMGLPEAALSTKYYFPAYNNVTLDGQLRFGNVGSSNTTVTVTIAGSCAEPTTSPPVKPSASITPVWMPVRSLSRVRAGCRSLPLCAMPISSTGRSRALRN
jgi:hypothetical protein